MFTASDGIFRAHCNSTFIPTAKFPPIYFWDPRSVAASKFSKQELGALTACAPYVVFAKLPREAQLPQPTPPPFTQLHKVAPHHHCSPLLLSWSLELLCRPGLPCTQCCWGHGFCASRCHRTSPHPTPAISLLPRTPTSGLDFHHPQSCLLGLMTTSKIVFVAGSVLREMLGR